MARAAAEGHRVVVVFATGGERGEVPGDLGPDETLVDRRRAEAAASARATGAARVAWLGYTDSGMTGWESNAEPGCFHLSDLDEAAERLAAILDEEDADVIVGYDWHGGYGHPDHVKVHRVVHRAAEFAARSPRVLEATMNRDHLRRLVAAAATMGLNIGLDPDGPMDDGNPMGTPEAQIHHAVDIGEHLAAKRAALACHASQASDIGSFLAIPEDQFALAFTTEYYIEPALAPDVRSDWIL